MALAAYFSKDLLAISQVLKKGSSNQFRESLNQSVIGIAFDDAVATAEGIIIIDLTVRLLSRLYSKLRFIDYSTRGNSNRFEMLSKSINSKIELVSDEPTATLVIGTTPYVSPVRQPVFYIGSLGWIAKFSANNPVGSGDQQNPFGAGLAACVGTSNVFRHVFKEFIDAVEFDEEFSLSVLTLRPENPLNDLKPLNIDLEDFTLVGFGAIGNGAVWALSHLPLVQGKLTLVEPQTVDLTNLQRYFLAEEKHIGESKLTIAQDILKGNRLVLDPVENAWSTYLSTKRNWLQKSLLIAVDNIEDRIAIQSALPRVIMNSYTETELVGIARHRNFVNEACVVCTYMPTVQKKSYSQEVSDNLGIPNLENKVRNYLHYNLNADEQLLRWVSNANSVEYSDLEKFKGLPVSDFYSKIVCGGILMQLRNDSIPSAAVEAPLAFQSAIAGILLVAEKVIEKGNLRKDHIPNKTHFYPLLPIKRGCKSLLTFFSKGCNRALYLL